MIELVKFPGLIIIFFVAGLDVGKIGRPSLTICVCRPASIGFGFLQI